MGDEGIDPCECIWSHEMAMRRLIAWLRQSQAYCTDNECQDDNLLPDSNPQSGFLMMSLFIAFVLAMFMMRPSSLRNNSDSKPPIHDRNVSINTMCCNSILGHRRLV